MINTLVYTLLAAGFDIVLGAAIAFLLLRSRVPGRNFLDAVATLPLAIPGVVLAVGYLAGFSRLGFSRRRRAVDLLVVDPGGRLHHAPAALHGARLLCRPAAGPC